MNDMKMADGAFWSIPITLFVSKEEASKVRKGQEVALVDNENMASLKTCPMERMTS